MDMDDTNTCVQIHVGDFQSILGFPTESEQMWAVARRNSCNFDTEHIGFQKNDLACISCKLCWLATSFEAQSSWPKTEFHS